MTTSEICHKFAHGATTSSERGNVFIRDGVLYSYGEHFPLAIPCGTINGTPAFMVNSSSYSNSTSRQQSELRPALSHAARIYVPLAGNPRWDRDNGKYAAKIVDAMHADQVAAERAAANVRPGTLKHGGLLADAQRMATTAASLAPYLKGAGMKVDRKTGAKLKKIAAWSVGDPAALKAAIEKETARRERAETKAKKAQMEAEAERLALWVSGADVYSYFHSSTVALRLKGGMVETSHGAKVSERTAKLLLTAWRAGRNVVGMDADGYKVNAQSPSLLKIGCHDISRAAAEDLAAREGWDRKEEQDEIGMWASSN